MKIQIGVMGSAGGSITSEELALSHRLGARIAQRNCVIVTGACPGIPHAAVLGAHEHGGLSLGVSPAHSREEHTDVYTSPLEPYDAIVFTGSGLMGREVHNIHSSDFVIFVHGRSGTLGEFAIAYDEGKLIGILLHSGGLSDHFQAIAKMCNKQTGSILIASDNPEELIDRCLDAYIKTAHSSAPVFDQNGAPRVITQETGG